MKGDPCEARSRGERDPFLLRAGPKSGVRTIVDVDGRSRQFEGEEGEISGLSDKGTTIQRGHTTAITGEWPIP